MFDNRLVFSAESRGRSESVHIALRGVVAHGIGPANRLKSAIGTTGNAFRRPQAGNLLRLATVEQIFVPIRYRSQPECIIPKFGQHSGFVGSIDISIIVIDDYAVDNPCRRLQVDEPDRKRRQDFTQNKRRKLFDEHLSRFIEFDDIIQRLFVKFNETIVISSPIGIVFRQSVRIERPDEDTVKSVFSISIDNLLRKAERILRGRHQCGNSAFTQCFARLRYSGNNALIAVRFSSVVVV